jgi:hypothetical protein
MALERIRRTKAVAHEIAVQMISEGLLVIDAGPHLRSGEIRAVSTNFLDYYKGDHDPLRAGLALPT